MKPETTAALAVLGLCGAVLPTTRGRLGSIRRWVGVGTLIVAAGILLVTLAHAETCKPPNVARTVYPEIGSSITVKPSLRVPSWQLACPHEGPCQHVYQHGMETHLDVVCLTPEQNAQAESRWR